MILMLRVAGIVFIIVGVVWLLSDKEKLVGYASFLLSAVAFIISIFPINHTQEIIPTGNPIEEPTPYEDETIDEPEETPDSDESPQIGEVFSGNEWKGSLVEGESDSIKYQAEKSGIYRFDFDIQNVENEYVLCIYDSNGDVISDVSSSYGEGITQELEAGHIYELELKQDMGEGEYCVKIYCPDDKMTVSDNRIEGQLRYTDQNNEYTYIAPRSGTYRFDFDITDVETQYDFSIKDSRNERLKNSNSSENGITVDLVKDETYTVMVSQSKGLSHYTISIGVPKNVSKINKNKVSGSIKFEDQEDSYNYAAPRSGIYRLDFTINDVNNEYQVIIKDNKNEQLKTATSEEDGCTVELEKGMNYQIIIRQYKGLCNYKVKVNTPNEIVSTQSSLLSGKLSYVDQNDVYYYKVNKTGNYSFEFQTSDTESEYSISLYEWNNETLFYRHVSDKSVEVRLEKNKKYKLHIKQEKGFEHYNIKINPA